MRHLLRHNWWTGLWVRGRRRHVGSDCSRSARGPLGGGSDIAMIRVVLPAHLRTLAHVDSEVELDIKGEVTLNSVLDALEAMYPMLLGTIRDQVTQQRRPFLRFFACEEDLSYQSPDAALPDAVAAGAEPFLVIGAIAGG